MADLGIDGELLDGDPSYKVKFGDAKQIALDACAINPLCDQQAAQTAWNNADTTNTGEVDRLTQAETMCASYGGGSGCSGSEEELVEWMCDKQYTTRCDDNFDGDAPMTIGQTWSFNERPFEDDEPDYSSGGGGGGGTTTGGSPTTTVPTTGPSEAYLVGPVSATEGRPLRFEVRLSKVTSREVIVILSTAADPAAVHPADAAGAQRDYLPLSNFVVRIPAGSLSATMSVNTIADTADEHDETLLLRIVVVARGERGSPDTAVGTIIDNDGPSEAYLGGPVSATEGRPLQFEVRVSKATSRDVIVFLSTAADPAAVHPADAAGARRDYLPLSAYSYVIIPAGSLSATMSVNTIADTADEHDETLLLRIDSVGSVGGGEIGSPDTAVGTIIDDTSLTPAEQCVALHGPGWTPVLYPGGTPWTDAHGQIICAMPH